MNRRIGSRVVRWLVVAAMCVLPVQGFALTVNTGDIADGAVTTPKIADGAITAPKLGIVCPDGQYLKYTAGSGWACNVGTPGPQGPQGVAGPQGLQGVKGDAGLNGPQGPTGLTGLQGDTGAAGPQGPMGLTGATGPAGPQGPEGLAGATGPQGPAGQAPHYANVVVVAKSGGDFSDPVAAMNSISDASAANPYLLKIMPGVYDLGISRLNLKSFVDIEGSGEGITKIQGVSADNFGVVVGDGITGKTEIRNISIEAVGPSGYSTAFSFATVNPLSIKLSHVTLIATGGTSVNYTVFFSGSNTSVEISHATLIATGAYYTYGIIGGVNKFIINDSTISCSGSLTAQGMNVDANEHEINNTAINAVGSDESIGIQPRGFGSAPTTLMIKGSTIKAATYPTSNKNWGILFDIPALSSAGIAYTQLAGGIHGVVVDTKCVGVYDVNFAPVTCPQ